MTNTLFEESGFEFDFSNSINAYKADNPAYHGLSAVDFIVETSEEFLFIEVKNPDNKKASEEKRQEFLEEMKNEKYYLKMAGKFKDSLLKELAMSKIFSKPITYILILEYSIFDARQRSYLYQRINNHIPKLKEEIYKSLKNIKFKLHNKEEFIKTYMFNVTEI